ncbi:MAG: MmcQ/YjbR family DNA-binding protein [Clostridiales bacterium]|nr:MmcQ/YjbR family DNA-binding protein [Clostridiales bacterium]
MRYTWLDEYLMSKPSVTKNTENWNWVRYMIGGKMFVAICLDDHDVPYYITLKLDPIEGEFFRKQYEDIVPGFYMNKIHWNSIKPDGNVPDDLLKTFVDKSYQLILKGFSKKMQQEILSGAQQ